MQYRQAIESKIGVWEFIPQLHRYKQSRQATPVNDRRRQAGIETSNRRDDINTCGLLQSRD